MEQKDLIQLRFLLSRYATFLRSRDKTVKAQIARMMEFWVKEELNAARTTDLEPMDIAQQYGDGGIPITEKERAHYDAPGDVPKGAA